MYADYSPIAIDRSHYQTSVFASPMATLGPGTPAKLLPTSAFTSNRANSSSPSKVYGVGSSAALIAGMLNITADSGRSPINLHPHSPEGMMASPSTFVRVAANNYGSESPYPSVASPSMPSYGGRPLGFAPPELSTYSALGPLAGSAPTLFNRGNLNHIIRTNHIALSLGGDGLNSDAPQLPSSSPTNSRRYHAAAAVISPLQAKAADQISPERGFLRNRVATLEEELRYARGAKKYFNHEGKLMLSANEVFESATYRRFMHMNLLRKFYRRWLLYFRLLRRANTRPMAALPVRARASEAPPGTSLVPALLSQQQRPEPVTPKPSDFESITSPTTLAQTTPSLVQHPSTTVTSPDRRIYTDLGIPAHVVNYTQPSIPDHIGLDVGTKGESIPTAPGPLQTYLSIATIDVPPTLPSSPALTKDSDSSPYTLSYYERQLDAAAQQSRAAVLALNEFAGQPTAKRNPAQKRRTSATSSTQFAEMKAVLPIQQSHRAVGESHRVLATQLQRQLIDQATADEIRFYNEIEALHAQVRDLTLSRDMAAAEASQLTADKNRIDSMELAVGEMAIRVRSIDEAITHQRHLANEMRRYKEETDAQIEQGRRQALRSYDEEKADIARRNERLSKERELLSEQQAAHEASQRALRAELLRNEEELRAKGLQLTRRSRSQEGQPGHAISSHVIHSQEYFSKSPDHRPQVGTSYTSSYLDNQPVAPVGSNVSVSPHYSRAGSGKWSPRESRSPPRVASYLELSNKSPRISSEPNTPLFVVPPIEISANPLAGLGLHRPMHSHSHSGSVVGTADTRHPTYDSYGGLPPAAFSAPSAARLIGGSPRSHSPSQPLQQRYGSGRLSNPDLGSLAVTLAKGSPALSRTPSPSSLGGSRHSYSDPQYSPPRTPHLLLNSKAPGVGRSPSVANQDTQSPYESPRRQPSASRLPIDQPDGPLKAQARRVATQLLEQCLHTEELLRKVVVNEEAGAFGILKDYAMHSKGTIALIMAPMASRGSSRSSSAMLASTYTLGSSDPLLARWKGTTFTSSSPLRERYI